MEAEQDRGGEPSRAAAPGPRRLRLFVALELPEGQRELIARWQHEELEGDAWRPVSRENLHVTLTFLGSTDPEALPAVRSAVEGLRGEAAGARFHPRPVPRPRRRPRIYALELESPGAVALAGRVESALRDACGFEPDERPFWPHVTVARARRGGDRRRSPKPGPLPSAVQEPFECVRVALYRSETRPQGARYERIAGVELPSPKDPDG